MHAGQIFLVLAGIAAAAAAQAAHNGYIWIEGPEEVLEAGTTYTLEVWGRIESPLYIEGESMLAGFGIDILNTGGGESVAAVSNVRIEPWAEEFGVVGTIHEHSIYGSSGGQMAVIDFPQNPPEFENPVRLFSFDLTTGAGALGLISFAPANPNNNGGLSFYPDFFDGASVVIPNDDDTTLHLSGWSSTVPGPGGVLPMLLAALARRRCR